jgi:hypothetical protein
MIIIILDTNFISSRTANANYTRETCQKRKSGLVPFHCPRLIFIQDKSKTFYSQNSLEAKSRLVWHSDNFSDEFSVQHKHIVCILFIKFCYLKHIHQPM